MKRIAMVLVLMGGCAPMAPFEPVHVAKPDNAFGAASRALIDAGETIETKDEAAGLVVTKWNEETRMGTLFRMRWRVEIDAAEVVVDSQCQEKLADKDTITRNDWEDCKNQAGDRGAKAKKLADAIRSGR